MGGTAYGVNKLITPDETFMQKHGGKVAAGVALAGIGAGAYAYQTGMFDNGDDEGYSQDATLNAGSSRTRRKSGSKNKNSGSTTGGDSESEGGIPKLVWIFGLVLIAAV